MQNKSQNFLEEIMRKKKTDLFQNSLKTQNFGVSDNQISINTKNLRFRRLFSKKNKTTSVIAEIKFASPTNPNLGSSIELVQRAKQYEKAGADAISIITEKHFFKGDISFVSQIKKHISLPVLQKDFVIDPLQIYEAKQMGTDALLLIARLVDAQTLKKFVKLCIQVGIEPVVEINNQEDLEKAIAMETKIIAVNARDLETFAIDVSSACQLIKKIPEQFIKLGFSGINSAKEVSFYKNAGAKGVLVGTSLMQAKNMDSFIKSLQV